MVHCKARPGDLQAAASKGANRMCSPANPNLSHACQAQTTFRPAALRQPDQGIGWRPGESKRWPFRDKSTHCPTLASASGRIVCAVPISLPSRERGSPKIVLPNHAIRITPLSGQFAGERGDAAEAVEFANSSTRVSTGPHQCVCQSYAVPSVTKLAL